MPTPAGEARLAVRTGAAGLSAAQALGWGTAAGICAISFYVLRGLFNFEQDTLGRVLGWIGGPGKWVQSKIESGEHKLTHWVGTAAASAEARMGYAFHSLAVTAASIGWEIQQQALDYWHVIAWVAKASKSIATGEAWQEIFHNTIYSTQSKVKTIERHQRVQDKAISHAAAADTVPGLRARTRAAEDAVATERVASGSRAATAEHGIDALWDAVKGINLRTVGLGAVALTGVALARLGLGWVRCSGVARVGKRLCGMDPRSLDDLLAGTLAIVGTISLITFAKEMQAVVEAEANAMRALIRETRG